MRMRCSILTGSRGVPWHVVQSAGGFWLVSGSADRTLKLWDCASLLLPRASSSASLSPVRLRVASTTLAHEKDINCLAVSPGDRFIACGSQDKSISLWSTAADVAGATAGKKSGGGGGGGAGKLGLKASLVLKGHRRGVWCVDFSSFDKVVASASGDKTVKIWSIATGQCLRTFEGHTNTVLRVSFLNRGMQLMSAGADSRTGAQRSATALHGIRSALSI
jgi:U3 small nucleolar RNA-associated protein 13